MKKTTSILLLFFVLTFGYSQNYSSNNIEKRIIELTKIVTDTVYIDYETIKKLETPKLEYWVNSRIIGNEFSSNPNFSDNEMYSIFKKILKKGKVTDFIKMCESDNPSIRIYGFWALVIKKEYRKAKEIMESEKNKNSYVYWNSMGCVVEPIPTLDLMKELIEGVK